MFRVTVFLEPILGTLGVRWGIDIGWDTSPSQGTMHTHTHTSFITRANLRLEVHLLVCIGRCEIERKLGDGVVSRQNCPLSQLK